MRLILITLGFCLLTNSLKAQNNQIDVNVMSINVRYNTERDGDHRWDLRKASMVKMLLHYHVDLFGVQEALLEQMNYLDKNLIDFQYIGVGRDNGASKGEFSGIFFNAAKYNLIQEGTFWLSETPESPSLGWDAAYPRICTYGEFEDKLSGKRFIVFNTHFDHQGKTARTRSANLIIEKIQHLNKKDLPVILTGDFNATPKEQPITLVTNSLIDGKMVTTSEFYGPTGTFNGFKNDPMDRRLDYIFVKRCQVARYIHIDDRTDQNRPISDHLPILATVRF